MAKKDIASVLAFEKKFVPSDGFMYGTTWANRLDPDELTPLKLKEKSVRGTISNRLKPAEKDASKLNAKVESPNLQHVDSCSLGLGQDTLKLTFTLKILSGVENPSACNNEGFRKKYGVVVADYIASEGFEELAKRYATNIANGRFLWRNRVGAEDLEVVVGIVNSETSWKFDASSFSIRDFDNEDISDLAGYIADVLSGKKDFLLLKIEAYARVGFAQDVYPSEELVLGKENKAKGAKTKILFSVEDIAAMHSQKIGNAIRTIDTWYPDYQDLNIGPIAIEPYGAVTNRGVAYRNPKAKADFFTLFDQWVATGKLKNTVDKHYVMAVLLRGGVFGESDKE